MPTYDYLAKDPEAGCETCRTLFEITQSIKDEPLKKCPHCGKPIERQISRVAINTRGEKSMMSDRNLKEKGFKKLVKQDDGSYKDVLEQFH